VDVMGNPLAVVVHAANLHGTKSGILPARKAFENIRRFSVSAPMRNTAV